MQKNTIMAVFDGVGSWSIDKDIDPSKFSKALARAAEEFSCSDDRQAEQNISESTHLPQRILQYCWKQVAAQKIPGGSTACIVTHRENDKFVYISNLGDSGVLILRPKQTSRQLKSAFTSAFQWHYFNCPLQLGIQPDGSIDKFDLPAVADQYEIEVQPGDYIVLSTDGLWDNLTQEEILKIVESGWLNGDSEEQIARVLADRALELGWDKMTDSPFAALAREENILWRGGRPDDITILLARVCA